MNDDRFGYINLGSIQNFSQVNLIRTTDDRLWIVHHDQSFSLGPSRQPVGVMIDRGGFSNEQGVEFE